MKDKPLDPVELPALVPGQALEGALSDVGLATVLAIFDLERRSGIITLLTRHNQPEAEPRLGQVLVREGRAVSATICGDQDQQPVQGREALYQLLDWREGRFGFRPGFVDAADELHGSTSELLLDAARRLDEDGVWGPSAKISLSPVSS